MFVLTNILFLNEKYLTDAIKLWFMQYNRNKVIL